MAWETGWQTLSDNLVGFYFGSTTFFFVALLLLFFILLIVSGVDFRYALLFSLPLVAGMSLGGAFGAVGWVYSVALLVVSIVYAYAILKIFT